jgi:hypothetical protein
MYIFSLYNISEFRNDRKAAVKCANATSIAVAEMIKPPISKLKLRPRTCYLKINDGKKIAAEVFFYTIFNVTFILSFS